MPFRVSSSSAALAAVTRSQVVSSAATARSPRYSWACRMMSYRAIMDFRSPWNIRCTSAVSAPARRRIRRRLKGAAAGAVGEVLGIQHDACQQGLRLAFEDVPRLHQVLQQLRHQLTRRRRRRARG